MTSAADHPSSANSPRAAPNPSTLRFHFVPGEHGPPPPSDAPIAPPEASPKPVENVGSSSDAAPPWRSDSPDRGGDCNAAAANAAARGKKPAWNVPSNGSIEVGPVMGAISWPALSEAARASPKSSSSDSLKALSNGSVSPPQGPMISSSSPKPIVTNPNPNPPLNHSAPTRPKSTKGPGGGVAGASSSVKLANGGPALPSLPLAQSEISEVMPRKQSLTETSPQGISNYSIHSSSSLDNEGRGGGFPPQPHGGNDHHRSYNGNRRGNIGGGGTHHNNYGNRRDQERGNHEWNHRNFSSRDAHMQQLPQQRGVRPYLRPAVPVSAPFIPPPPQVRPFGHQMGYPDMTSPVYYVPTHPPPESLRGVPFVAHPAPPAMFFPALDPQRAMLLKQIDYYFSADNLCKDIYLRQNMDSQGWVSIPLIASFKKVKQLTNNIQYILDTMQLSTVVEAHGGRIRRRNDWMKWVLPPTSGPQSPASPSYDTLADHLQTVRLEEGTSQNSTRGGAETVLTRSTSVILNNQHHVVGDHNGDGNVQLTGRIDSDRSRFVRSLARSDTM